MLSLRLWREIQLMQRCEGVCAWTDLELNSGETSASNRMDA
jgi:hypothetical protein